MVVAALLVGGAAAAWPLHAQSTQDVQQQAPDPKGPTGSIEGCVTDPETGEGVAGTQLVIVGQSIGALADADGCYVLYDVPPGNVTVRAAYLGYNSIERTVSVEVGAVVRADFSLPQAPIDLGGELEVDGPSLLWRALVNGLPLLGIFLGLELAAVRMAKHRRPPTLVPLLGGLTQGLVAATVLAAGLFWSTGRDPLSQVEAMPYWWSTAGAALWLTTRRGPQPPGSRMGWGLLGGLIGAAAWLVVNAAGYLTLTTLGFEPDVGIGDWVWFLVTPGDVASDLLVGAGVGYLIAVWLSPPNVQGPAEDGRRAVQAEPGPEAKTSSVGASEKEEPAALSEAEAQAVQSAEPQDAVESKVATPEPPGPVVFLSYRRDDAGKDAYRLYDRLTQAFGDDRVFMDMEDIAPGDDFASTLRQAVERSTHVLVVIGPNWVRPLGKEGSSSGDIVAIEIETALQMGIRTIPVLVSGADMPPMEALPAPLQTLARLQAFELRSRRSFAEDADRLIMMIEQTVGPPPTQSS